jgi:hypothetical protein
VALVLSVLKIKRPLASTMADVEEEAIVVTTTEAEAMEEDGEEVSSSRPPQQGLRQGLAEEYEDKSFADVAVVCADGQTIKLHKLLIGAVSPMLRRALEGVPLDADPVVTMLAPDVVADHLDDFLRSAVRGGETTAEIPESLAHLDISPHPVQRRLRSVRGAAMAGALRIKSETADYYGSYPGHFIQHLAADDEDDGAWPWEGGEDPFWSAPIASGPSYKRMKKDPEEVWQYFFDTDDEVECKICQKRFGRSSNNGGLLRHLIRKHPDLIGYKKDGRRGPGRPPKAEAGLLEPKEEEPDYDENGDIVLSNGEKIKRAKSNVWKFFRSVDDNDEKAACVECGKAFRKGSGTSTMARHLKTTHLHLWVELETLNKATDERLIEEHEERRKENLEKFRKENPGVDVEALKEGGGSNAASNAGSSGTVDEKENTEPVFLTPKGRVVKPRSMVWQHFRRTPDGRAVCKQCEKSFIINNGM